MLARTPPVSAALALVCVGSLGITGQLVLLRELITAFSGNEFSIALMLAVWIGAETAGAFACGRLARRHDPALWFVPVALVSVLFSVAAVPAAILARPALGALPGETLTLPLLGLVALFVAGPPALAHGALFVAGAALIDGGRDRSAVPGFAYLWEGVGTTAAAAAVSFGLVVRLSSLALTALAAVPLTAALLLPGPGRSRWTRAAALVALAAVLLLGLGPAAGLERRLWQRHWPGQSVLDVANSPYGKVVRIGRAGQQQVLFAGVPVLHAPALDVARSEELVGIPLLFHPRPQRVLVIGQALGGPATVALGHGVSQLVTTEPDPVLARALVATGDSTVNSELADPRHLRRAADPRRLLAADTGRFDVIVMTDPAPFSLSANRLFTLEAFRLCRLRLNPGGILCLSGPGSADRTRLAPDVERLAALRLAALGRAFPHVLPLAADFPLFLASDRPLSEPPETLARRLVARQAAGQVLDSAYLVALLDSFRQREFVRRLVRAVPAADLNTDQHPRELFLNMVRAYRAASPLSARLYETAGRLNRLHLLAALGILLAISLVRGRQRRFAVGLAVASSGFAGAGLSGLLLFAYQARFGSLYTQAALLIAGFMLGSVLGAAGVTSFPVRRRAAALLGADLVLAALGVGAAIGPAAAPAWLFVFGQLLAGAGLGAQFAAAGADPAGPAAARTGVLAALDLAGGACGAFLCGLVLVPALGFGLTALGLAGLKAVSAAGLVRAAN